MISSDEGRLNDATARARWRQGSLVNRLASVACIALCVYVMLYVSGIFKSLGIYIPIGINRAIGLGFFLSITFLIHPAGKELRRDRPPRPALRGGSRAAAHPPRRARSLPGRGAAV